MTVSLIVRPPSDKSLTHRALLLAGMSSGHCAIERPLTSGDARSMASALRRLGVAVSPLRGRVTVVRGLGTRGWLQPPRSLHLGNAGTAVRLLMGAVAGMPIRVRFTGDASLRSRPMRRVTNLLRTMGATVIEDAGDGLPLVVEGGKLRSCSVRTEVASAQVKSAVLLAGLAAGVAVRVTEPRPTRDHTERMLAALGCDVEVGGGGTVMLDPAEAIPPFQYRVPGDPSSAAFLIAAAVLRGRPITVEEVGLNPGRIGFHDVLRRMGVTIELQETGTQLGEPVGTMTVGVAAALRGVRVPADVVPGLIDEIPILAAVASRAAGQTVFEGVGELRVKESNRLEGIAANLRAIGGSADVTGDRLTVHGSDAPLGGRVATHGDHRLAMAFAVLGSLPGADVQLSERASPAISYPDFFADLTRVVHGG